MSEKIHVFEIAELGKAPFRVVGAIELPSKSLLEANPAAYNAVMASLPNGIGFGTCHYCGHDLKYNFIIKSADEKRFVVGSECVYKTGDKGMIDKVKYELRKIAREKRFAKAEQERLIREQAAKEKLHRIRVLLEHVAEVLKDGKGGFRDDVAKRMMLEGNLPYGRGLDITLDILAKQCGKRGSDKYHNEFNRVIGIFNQVRELK